MVSPDDAFNGTALDFGKWEDRSYEGGQISQNERLIASSGSEALNGTARVFTQYAFLGDFDVQTDFRLGSGWGDVISAPSGWPQLTASLGLYIDGPRWMHITRTRDPGGNTLAVYSNIPGAGNIASIGSNSTTGRLRIVRTGSTITFKYDTGAGWHDLGEVVETRSPVYLFLQSNHVGINHATMTYFDNFKVNSGSTTYVPLRPNDTFRKRPEFYVGGVPSSLPKWTDRSNDVLQELKDNGLKWVRVGVTTVSSSYLRTTPPEQWDTLPWRDEYWFSREYAEELLRESQAKAYRLNLFFFLSDKAAHAGQQDAPAEWAGLSVAETASRVESHTYEVTNQLVNDGVHVELYDIGNEIELGILNFRPNERIAVPPGVDFSSDTEYMRAKVWPTEAILLKSAIAGIKRADPDAKIVLHVSGLGGSPGEVMVKAFFRTMVERGVDFDYAGLSHPYPTDGWLLPGYPKLAWFQHLQGVVDYIAGLGKDVIFSEAGYPGATLGITGAPMLDYAYTRGGQAAWVRDQLRFASNQPHVLGFFYFYPEWYPGQTGSASTLNLESSGLYSSSTAAAPALGEFRANLFSNPGPRPQPPSGFTAQQSGGSVALTWANSLNIDHAATRILRSQVGFAASPIETIGQTKVFDGATGTHHLDDDVEGGTHYYYSAFSRDVWGLWSEAATAMATAKSPTSLNASASKTVLPYGGSSTIAGTLSSAGLPLGGRRLILQSSASVGGLSGVAQTVTTSSTGFFHFVVRPRSSTYYRVRFSGGDTKYADSMSARLRVVSKPYVGNPIAPRTSSRAKTFSVYGYLKPRYASGTYPVRIYKWRKTASGKWKSYGYVKARAYNHSTYTKYSRKLKLAYKGKWRLRAFATANSAHSAGWSRKYDYVRVK